MVLPSLPFPVPVLLLGSIVLAVMLVYLPFLAVVAGRIQVGYEIATPRAMFDKLPPYAQRATWAHQNGFESLTVFAPAALMAYVTGLDSLTVGWAAIAYLLARLLYPVFYILNVAIARSLMYAIGAIAIFTLYLQSLFHVARF
jgi:uncharacterized MAPEG superfamily protein